MASGKLVCCLCLFSSYCVHKADNRSLRACLRVQAYRDLKNPLLVLSYINNIYYMLVVPSWRSLSNIATATIFTMGKTAYPLQPSILLWLAIESCHCVRRGTTILELNLGSEFRIEDWLLLEKTAHSHVWRGMTHLGAPLSQQSRAGVSNLVLLGQASLY